ncbi:OLC1v1003980C1 [Oldenlandia corymbosa var. corymbosa]|uniref:OLC1v1003980C1 n=1 Tax=Oldenlandia corymbosa var. corymbosa TaxID=529605 RepID=A0AAV1DE78_OLDCO|nr:OLC1v1003980C1 [Oldenlandia corymbosa var. corymbosa]
MMKQVSFPLSLLVIIALFQCQTEIQAQVAPSPGPAGPTNITKILEKAGQFTTFIRLMKVTSMSDQINNQLNNSQNGMTVLAPTDNAFSSLKAGTLNSLTDQQKVQLMQFHVIPSYLSMSQFQTVSNPVRTQAGDVSARFPLNVTTSGNQVNVSTGVDDATVDNAIYTDGQLAVYQVDKVLLPLSLFGAPSPAEAPAPLSALPKKKKPSGGPESGDDAPAADSSGAAADAALHGMVACLGAGILFLATFWS